MSTAAALVPLTATGLTPLTAADWPAISAELDAAGCAVTPPLLTSAQCRDLADLYDRPELFRSTVDMGRHLFGSGQYRYFTHDLPGPVRALREAFYPHLLTIARSWAGRLGRPAPWPRLPRRLGDNPQLKMGGRLLPPAGLRP